MLILNRIFNVFLNTFFKQLFFSFANNRSESTAFGLNEWIPHMMTPHNPFWSASLLAVYTSISLNFLFIFLFIPTLFSLSVCKFEKRPKMFRRFCVFCQIITVAVFVLMVSVFVCFGIGIDHDVITSEDQLDYVINCGNPASFQPDLCEFSLGFYKSIWAATAQLLALFHCLAACFFDLQPNDKKYRLTSAINYYNNRRNKIKTRK